MSLVQREYFEVGFGVVCEFLLVVDLAPTKKPRAEIICLVGVANHF